MRAATIGKLALLKSPGTSYSKPSTCAFPFTSYCVYPVLEYPIFNLENQSNVRSTHGFSPGLTTFKQMPLSEKAPAINNPEMGCESAPSIDAYRFVKGPLTMIGARSLPLDETAKDPSCVKPSRSGFMTRLDRMDTSPVKI